MTVIGIDPGSRGAIGAIWTRLGGLGACADSIPRVGKDYDLRTLLAMFQPYLLGDSILAVVEDVHAMPASFQSRGRTINKGTIANFGLGRGLGIIEGMLGALEIPYRKVSSMAWKRSFALLGKDKAASRACAAKLFPSLDFSRVKDDGRAEALLIARYGFEKWAGAEATLSRARGEANT